jgi:hypothetical protein
MSASTGRGVLGGLFWWMALLIGLRPWGAALCVDAPTDLFVCGQQCYEVRPSGFTFDCNPTLTWTSAWGRSWFGPLRYVGPVEVSIQARPEWPAEQTLPLYIEIRADSNAGCVSRSGGLFWQTYGTVSCEPDSTWIRFPRTTLPLDVGREYWVQLFGLYQAQPVVLSSPYWRCLRVQAFPVNGVAMKNWGTIKALYK